ncbi:MAG TPA: intradiol ring-cleavage dioxygenase [Candidatus Dormibacteraeota bacterium]
MSVLEMVLTATISRRRMLIAGGGAVVSAALAACGLGRTSPVTTPTASGVPVATPACIVTPAETEGPYFVDERLNRADITTDPSDGSVRPGTPLTLTLTVARVGSQCTALQGAQVDVWHCDALGQYSDVAAENSVGKRFLRGYQTTDANGAVTFNTIYPGWYRGRAVHIHFKVRTFSGAQKSFEFTSQIFFDDAVSDEAYQQAPYSSRGSRDTRNAADMVYTSNGNSGAQLLANVSKAGSGYRATFAIGIQLS